MTIGMVVFIVLCMLVGMVARDRNRSFLFWTLLSLLITPLLGFVLLVVVELAGIGKRRLG